MDCTSRVGYMTFDGVQGVIKTRDQKNIVQADLCALTDGN